MSDEGKAEIDALLFPPGAFICAGSAQHREFWNFFDKYAAFRKKELRREASSARACAGQNPAGRSAPPNAPAGDDTTKEGAASGRLSNPSVHGESFQRVI